MTIQEIIQMRFDSIYDYLVLIKFANDGNGKDEAIERSVIAISDLLDRVLDNIEALG